MLLSSPASLLETQIKLVHDVTNRPLNEIRTDLEYTRDPQLTIDRIYGGEVDTLLSTLLLFMVPAVLKRDRHSS